MSVCGGHVFSEVRGTLVSRISLGTGAAWLEIRLPGPIPPVRAGQFALLSLPEVCDPLLGRPLAVAWAQEDRVSFLCRRAGRGSGLLADLIPGQSVDLRLPLGRPVEVPQDRPVWFLGGSVGAAPLLMAPVPPGFRGWVLGFRDASWGPALEHLRGLLAGLPLTVVCDDGSLGPKGNAVSALGERVRPGDCVVACGPEGMLQALRDLSRAGGFQAILGLERRMACGFGGCLGCRITRRDGTSARVCVDGPFFDGEELGDDVFA